MWCNVLFIWFICAILKFQPAFPNARINPSYPRSSGELFGSNACLLISFCAALFFFHHSDSVSIVFFPFLFCLLLTYVLLPTMNWWTWNITFWLSRPSRRSFWWKLNQPAILNVVFWIENHTLGWPKDRVRRWETASILLLDIVSDCVGVWFLLRSIVKAWEKLL